MKKISIFLSALSLMLIMAGSVKAALFDRGNGLIYDSILDITWLQDANYSGSTMIWDDAVTWADDLVFANYDDWRLPTFNCSGSDCTVSEIGHLYFVDNISSDSPGLFTDVRPFMYWSGTENSADPTEAWRFNFKSGSYGTSSKGYSRYAWAVRNGDSSLPVVPEPVSSLLFIAGGTVLAVRKRFCKIS